MVECAKGVYRPRRPRETAFYRLVGEHDERFEQAYPERYEDRYGCFRSVIRETVYKYLGCGDLRQGFARVRCRDCGHEYLLAPERIKLIRSWAHSGFNVNTPVRIGADDATERENLARYLIRAPFSMNKIRYDTAAQTVIYKTKMVEGPNRNFEIFEPLDFLAAGTSHIPNRGERRSLLFAADPLVCPDCGGAMRIIAFIEDQRIVRAILVHLLLWDEPRPPPVTPGAVPRAPAELEYLPWVE